MSIPWNKEITIKDVANFMNKEVNLKPVEKFFTMEVNVKKSLQVTAMIAVFGVLPSFTYGTVLGTLEGQQLSAQAVSAVSNRVIYNASTDKGEYMPGEIGKISFYLSSIPRMIRVQMLDTKGSVHQDLGPVTTLNHTFKIGLNTISRRLEPYATSTATSTESTFRIQLTNVDNSQQFSQTGKIDFKGVPVTPQAPVAVTFVSSDVYKTFDANLDGQKDVGSFKITYKVTAATGDVYLRKNGVAWATTTNTTTGKFILKTLVASDSSARDTQDSYFIQKGATRMFTLQVDLQATTNGYAGIAIKSIEWGTTSPSAYPDKTVRVDSSVFKTDVLYLRSLVQVGPTVSVSNTQSGVNVIRTANVSLSFVIDNTGARDIYVSKDGFRGIGYEASQAVASSTINGGSAVGDTQNAYIIRAGAKRFFSLNVGMVNSGPERLQSFAVKKIYYSDEPVSINRYNISSGLEKLRISQSF